MAEEYKKPKVKKLSAVSGLVSVGMQLVMSIGLRSWKHD